MRLERSANARKNIKWGLLNKLAFMIFPFVIRVLIIQYIGVEFLGLDSLYISILQVLNLAELGFSNAVVYHMYKPIADDDYDTLCALLNFYRRIYRYLGIIIGVVGTTLLPFIPLFIHGDMPAQINYYVLYVIYLVNAVSSYWLYAYRQSLLEAYQKVYVTLNVNMVTTLLRYILQILVLIFTGNCYLYALLVIAGTVANNLTLNYYTRKLFPKIICQGVLDSNIKQDIKEKVKGLIIGKVSGLAISSCDSIFVSYFLGLTQTAIYNNYFMVMNGVVGFFLMIYSALTGAVGNSIAMDDRETNYRNMLRLNFLYMWLSGVAASCLVCLYQPFMEATFGDELLFSMGVVVCFAMFFYVMRIGDMLTVYNQASGQWWETRYKNIAQFFVNMILNYVLGYFFGVIGIIIASVFTMLSCGFLWGSYIVIGNCFNLGLGCYYRWHFTYMVVTAVVVFITYHVAVLLPFSGWWSFGIRLVLCLLVTNVLYMAIYRPTKMYRDTMPWIIERMPILAPLRKVLI